MDASLRAWLGDAHGKRCVKCLAKVWLCKYLRSEDLTQMRDKRSMEYIYSAESLMARSSGFNSICENKALQIERGCGTLSEHGTVECCTSMSCRQPEGGGAFHDWIMSISLLHPYCFSITLLLLLYYLSITFYYFGAISFYFHL